MLVKSLITADHITLLKECFHILKDYIMKLSATKCDFGVIFKEFLRYIVTQRDISANTKPVSAILDLPNPKTNHEYNV